MANYLVIDWNSTSLNGIFSRFLYGLEARGEVKTAWLETLRVERSAGLVLLLGPYPQLHGISY